MNSEQHFYFSQLKSAIATTFLKHHSASNVLAEWKGETITDFQEDLFSKVKAKVSEKWFYTYFKNEAEKLPRIDMLNMLSVYVGFKNWNDFKNSQSDALKSKTKSNRKWKIVAYVVASIIPLLAFIFTMKENDNTFHFCFVDSIKNEAITSIPLDIKILQYTESPLYFKTDSMGCFYYKTKENRVQFVVQSPYHKTDTIIRTIDSKDNETVKLTTDDYALMLSYYTNGNIKDWNKHKERLQELISDDAQIYQLYERSMGIEIYSKDDFVRLLTIPTKSLKRIRILDKSLKEGKIVKLKFIVQ